MKRQSVNKSKSAAKFRAQNSRTKKVNVSPPLMRGGFRL